MIENKCNIIEVIKDSRLDRHNDGEIDENDFWNEMRIKKVKILRNDEEAINCYVSNNKGLLDYKKLDEDIRAFIEESKKESKNLDGKKKKKKRMK